MLSRKYHGTQRLAFKSEFYNELNSSPTKADQHNSSPEFWLRLGTFNLTQGQSVAGLDWDGLGALGHGVPVLGVDGYEYVRSRNRKS